MYAMQYEITLPADYDMGRIRTRVASRGAALDGFPGLGLKAYLLRERGVAGSAVNQYAPFYLWTSIAGMGRFLWDGGGFSGLIESFGRPAVLHWTGVAFAPGDAVSDTPSVATRSIVMLPRDADPAPIVAAARRDHAAQARLPGVHSSALAIDPERWALVQFTLWTDCAPSTPGTRYEVLHLSRPGIRDLNGSP